MSTDFTKTTPQSSAKESPIIQWQFIDSSNKSRSNLTRVKRHVMHAYMRQKRQGDETKEKTTKTSENDEPPQFTRQRSEKTAAFSAKTDEEMRKRDVGQTRKTCKGYSRETHLPCKPLPEMITSWRLTKSADELAQRSRPTSQEKGPGALHPGTLPAQLDANPAFRDQLVSIFLDAYLPSVTDPYQRVGGDFTGALPFRLGVSPMLDHAITALCAAYVGSLREDPMLRRKGVESYGKAVQFLRGCIERSTTSQDMLYVTASLQTYEVIQPSQHGMIGWGAHVQGCRALLQYGRDGSDSVLNDDELYRHMQMVIVAEAVIRRKSAYVPNPAWRPKVFTLFDQVLEMLVSCTTLMEALHQLEQERCQDKHTAGHHLLQRLLCVERELDTLYAATLSQIGFPDIWNAEETVEHEIIEEPDDLFFSGEAFCFSSFPMAQVHSLHWATRLLTYMTIERLCHLLGTFTIPEQPSAHDAECSKPASTARSITDSVRSQATRSHQDLIDLASLYAAMICRSVKYCFSPGMNAFGVQVLFVRLWLASQFYHSRHGYEGEYEWCRRVINRITTAGFQGAPDFMNIRWDPPPTCP